MSFKLLLMAGHGRNTDGSWDPGACGCGYQEAVLARELVKLLKAVADRDGIPCDIAPDRNHYSFFKHGGVYDVTSYTYVLEVHFNASAKTDYTGDRVMKGSMMYIDRSEKGHSVEDAILSNLYKAGSRQAWDGVVVSQRQWPTGLMVQNRVRAQGVSHAVLETCFMSDKDDVDWYLNNKVKIAEAIINGIKTGFGLGKQQSFKPYMVKITDPALNIRKGPGTNTAVVGCIRGMGVYTIISESAGPGASKWGELRSGAGWISLDYTKKI